MKQRIINTKFWSDGWIDTLDPTEKLLFLYLLTNERTNLIGVYELPLKLMSVETGIEKSMIELILDRFVREDKVARHGSWIRIVNAEKHQNINNPKIKRGIELLQKSLPEDVIDNLWIAYTYPMDTQVHSNPNLNSNPNSNLNPISKRKTTKKPAVDKRDPEITKVIEHFEKLIGKMSRPTFQPMAASELIKDHTFQKVIGAINATAATRGQPYAPNIASLEELRDKWIKLENFVGRKQVENRPKPRRNI